MNKGNSESSIHEYLAGCWREHAAEAGVPEGTPHHKIVMIIHAKKMADKEARRQQMLTDLAAMTAEETSDSAPMEDLYPDMGLGSAEAVSQL